MNGNEHEMTEGMNGEVCTASSVKMAEDIQLDRHRLELLEKRIYSNPAGCSSASLPPTTMNQQHNNFVYMTGNNSNSGGSHSLHSSPPDSSKLKQEEQLPRSHSNVNISSTSKNNNIGPSVNGGFTRNNAPSAVELSQNYVPVTTTYGQHPGTVANAHPGQSVGIVVNDGSNLSSAGSASDRDETPEKK